MSLKDVPLKGVYRTATDSLIRDFYLPALAASSLYDRAVGFFSSSMLIEASTGLSALIKNGGKMRLLIGHPLDDEDWAAVKEASKLASIAATLNGQLADLLDRAGTERSVYSLSLLSWMVATGALEIRFAYRKVGMYHEKLGVMKDKEGNTLVFQGSANESANALLPTRNFESLAVYPSWRPDIFSEYGAPFEQGFMQLWNNEAPNVHTVPVPSGFYEQLIEYRKGVHTPPDLEIEAAISAPVATQQIPHPALPRHFNGSQYELKAHQRRALTKWAANSYQGILALATGAGKTVTALHAATRFAEQNVPIVLVVAVPYQILAEQWADTMSLFSIKPIKSFYSRDQWLGDLDAAVLAFRSGARRFLAIVVVNDTLASAEFQERLQSLPAEALFFVGDECHHHASEAWKQRIPTNARYKLGLSATPWEPGRVAQKTVLTAIYGPVVDEYSLKDALTNEVLCPYTYTWSPCEFDDDEAEEYGRLSNLIASLVAQDPTFSDPSIRQQVQAHSSRRTRLLGGLRSKLRKLKQLLEDRGPAPHTLFYCGEGKHPLDGESRLIEDVTSVIAEHGWKVGRITASESFDERQRSLALFDEGVIEGIAAIRVLDEGFDIPSCRTALILASSNSYRQYVQRRGRVLRRSPGKRSAAILDFAAVPSQEQASRSPELWRKQLSTELRRIRDFVALAENSLSAEAEINKTLIALGFGGIYYEEAALSEEGVYGD